MPSTAVPETRSYNGEDFSGRSPEMEIQDHRVPRQQVLLEQIMDLTDSGQTVSLQSRVTSGSGGFKNFTSFLKLRVTTLTTMFLLLAVGVIVGVVTLNVLVPDHIGHNSQTQWHISSRFSSESKSSEPDSPEPTSLLQLVRKKRLSFVENFYY